MSTTQPTPGSSAESGAPALAESDSDVEVRRAPEVSNASTTGESVGDLSLLQDPERATPDLGDAPGWTVEVSTVTDGTGQDDDGAPAPERLATPESMPAVVLTPPEAMPPVVLTPPEPVAPVVLTPPEPERTTAPIPLREPTPPAEPTPALPPAAHAALERPHLHHDIDRDLERSHARRRAEQLLAERRAAARRLRTYGVLVALAGLLLALAGTAGYLVTRADLVNQSMRVSAAADNFAGDKVTGPLTAWAQVRQIDREVDLAGQGRSFAELPAGDPLRADIMEASFQRPALVGALTGFAASLAFAGVGIVLMLLGGGLLVLARGMRTSMESAGGSGRHASPEAIV